MANASIPKDYISYTHAMIDALCEDANYSYSRIAKRLGISRSTIQKCRKFEDRRLRSKSFFKLVQLYCRVFFSTHRTSAINALVEHNEEAYLSKLPKMFRDQVKMIADSQDNLEDCMDYLHRPQRLSSMAF